jgi:hypothetical protein
MTNLETETMQLAPPQALPKDATAEQVAAWRQTNGLPD